MYKTMYCTTVGMSNVLWFYNISLQIYVLLCCTEETLPAGNAMVVVMLFGQLLQWCHDSEIKLLTTHSNNMYRLSQHSYRKINKGKWEWTGFGQWWLQYLSVCTTRRRQVWDPQQLIRKIINKHVKGFNPQNSWFKNNISSLAKVMQDHFLSG